MHTQSQFGIFLVCKNNYELLEAWFQNGNYSDIPVLVLDISSNQSNLDLAKKLQMKFNFELKIAKSGIMQENILEALSYFHTKNIYWVMYTHQDTYPLTKNWVSLLNEKLNNLPLDKIGVVGFNIYHDNELKNWKGDTNFKLMTTARSPLELGNGYYDSRPGSRVNYENFDKNKIFLVETPMWTTCLFNVNYMSNIKIDKNFDFFHSIDDVCFQYLNLGIYNVVIPNICFAHDQSIKVKKGFEKNSSTSGDKKKIENLYGRFDHMKIWKKKWSFDYYPNKVIFGRSHLLAKAIDKFEKTTNFDFSSNLNTIARLSFDHKKFEGTLLNEFFMNDPKQGPLRYLD